MRNNTWSNAEGYGFWCGEKCVASKQEAGIPPLGASRASKLTGAQADMTLAQATLTKVQQVLPETWTPLAVGGVVIASLLGIATMVILIKKAKVKKA